MFDYLQKFNNLPKTLRDKVSSPTAMRAISALELKYKVDLAALVMKVMAKTLAVRDLPDYFINELSLSQEDARALNDDILKEVLAPVSEYLSLDETKRAPETNEFSSTLIKESGFSLPSEDLYIRLNNIMLTFLKGVRSKIDAKSALMKKVEFGGLGLSQEEADRVFKLAEAKDSQKELSTPEDLPVVTGEVNGSSIDQAIIDQAIKEEALATPIIEKSSKEKLDKIIMAAEMNSAPAYDLKKSLAEKKNKELVLPKEVEQNILPLMEDRLKLEEKLEIKPEPIKEAELKTDLKKEQEDYVAPVTLNLNFKRPAQISSKPKMEDIKPVAKAMGPIDELAFLDLVNFRRLSDNPDEAALKIFNKIKLLEKDGYDKMVSGVKAWRQNEVNRLYVKIGQEALLKDLSLKEVIVERQKRNMPFLKIEEINSISKLNGKLSF